MEIEFKPGLEGVPAARSTVGSVDGQNGVLEYRGISIEQLAENSTFEETAFLLIEGYLPTQGELDEFNDQLTHHRRLQSNILDLIKCLPEQGHPMDAMQAAVAAMGMCYPAKDVSDQKQNEMSVIRLVAKLPTIVAAFDRQRSGNDHIVPRDDLGHAANYLYMTNGEEPDPLLARTLDVCLILHADHGMNASTFSGRVTGSTLADPYTVVSSAIGTLSGPLHGGANERVLELLAQMKTEEEVRPFIEGLIKKKEKIMGMGHRVYKVKDPRANILQTLCHQVFEKFGASPSYSIAVKVEEIVGEHLGQKGIHANVDFYSGIVYEKMGIPRDTFTPIFAISRVAGWLAHWLEQLQDNRIFRPRQVYEGEHGVEYTPIEKRQ